LIFIHNIFNLRDTGPVVVVIVWYLSQLKLWVRTPFMGRCTRYNTMW